MSYAFGVTKNFSKTQHITVRIAALLTLLGAMILLALPASAEATVLPPGSNPGEVTITSRPPTVTTSQSATFSGDVRQYYGLIFIPMNPVVQCQLDGGTWSNCANQTWSQTYAGPLTIGMHSFRVRTCTIGFANCVIGIGALDDDGPYNWRVAAVPRPFLTHTPVPYLNATPAAQINVSWNNGDALDSSFSAPYKFRVQLQHREAPLANDVCGTYGAWTNIGAVNPANPYADTAISNGHCYQYRINDLDGDGNIAASSDGPDTTKVDRVAPAPTFTTPANGAVVGGTVPLAASTVENETGVTQVEFSYICVGGNAYTTISTDNSAPYTASWPTTSLPDGNCTLRARATDKAGNVGTTTITVTIDNTPPTITFDHFTEGSIWLHTTTGSDLLWYNPAIPAADNFTAYVNAADPHIVGVGFPGLGTGFTPAAGGNDNTAPYTFQYTINPGTIVEPGTKLVTATDTVGNSSTDTFQVQMDNTPPFGSQVTVTPAASGITNDANVVVMGLNGTDSQSGVRDHTIRAWTAPLTGGNCGTFTEVTPFTEGAHTLTEGCWQFGIDTYDNVNNVEHEVNPNILKVDLHNPFGAITTPSESAFLRATVSVNANGEDFETGVARMRLTYSGTASGTVCDLSDPSPELHITTPAGHEVANVSCPWDTTSVADGAYTLTLTVWDDATNTVTATPVHVTVDNTPPPASFFQFVPQTQTQQQYALSDHLWVNPGAFGVMDEGNFLVRVNASDALSGVQSVAYPFLGASWSAGGNGTNYTAGKYQFQYSWLDSPTPVEPGTKYVVVTDVAGNTTSVPFTITLDTTPPSGLSLSYTDGYVTSGATLPLSFNVGSDDFLGAGMRGWKLERAEATLSNNACGAFGAWTLVTQSTNIAANSYADTVDDAKCYQYRLTSTDNVDNSAAVAPSFIAKIDRVKPTGTISAIPAGPVKGTQTITGTSADAESGVQAISVSYSGPNTGSLNASCTGLEVWSCAWDTTTVADGTYTIQLLVTDYAGNVSDPITRTIVVDNTAPVLHITNLDATADPAHQYGDVPNATFYYNPAYTGSTHIEVSATDATSGVDHVTFPDIDASPGGFTPDGGTDSAAPWEITVTRPTGVNHSGDSDITGTDHAGNEGQVTLHVVADDQAPTGQAISYTTGWTNATSNTVTFTGGSDSQSGWASTELERHTAPIVNGVCGAFGAWTNVATLNTPAASNGTYTESPLPDATCIEYRVRSTDRVGNVSDWTSNGTTKVDRTAPTVTDFHLAIDPGVQNVQIHNDTTACYGPGAEGDRFYPLLTTDDSFGVVDHVVFPHVNNMGAGAADGAETINTPSIGGAYTTNDAYKFGSGTLSAGGVQTAQIVDAAGNVTTAQFTITLDDQGPIAPVLSGTTSPEWVNATSVMVSAASSDDQGACKSGVDHYRYEIVRPNGAGTTAGTGSFANVTDEGKSIVRFWAIDAFGNESAPTEGEVWIDRTTSDFAVDSIDNVVPSTSSTPTDPWSDGDQSNAVDPTPTSPTLMCYRPGGVNAVRWRVITTATDNESGINRIVYPRVNNLGAGSIDGRAVAYTPYSGNHYTTSNASRVYTFGSTATAQGMQEIRSYSDTVPNPTPVDPDQAEPLAGYASAEDPYNDPDPYTNGYFQLVTDTQAPVWDGSPNFHGAVTPPSTWATSGPFTVTMSTAHDNGCAQGVTYTWTTTGAQTDSGTGRDVEISAEGETTITFTATDEVGNTTTYTVVTGIDSSNPTLDAPFLVDVDNSPWLHVAADDSTFAWYNPGHNITPTGHPSGLRLRVQITAQDSPSKIARVEFPQIFGLGVGGVGSGSSSTITLTPPQSPALVRSDEALADLYTIGQGATDGNAGKSEHSVTVYDQASNSAQKSFWLRQDAIKPTTPTVTGAPVTTWTTIPVTLTASGSLDSESGLRIADSESDADTDPDAGGAYEYSINNGPWHVGNQVSFDCGMADGVYVVRQRSVDNVNNTSTSVTTTIRLDCDGPMAYFQDVVETTNPQYQYFDPDFAGTPVHWVNGNAGKNGTFTVRVVARDTMSGVTQVTFPGLGTGFTPGAGSIDTTGSGATNDIYDATYAWNPGAVDSGIRSAVAYDGALNSAAVPFRVRPDYQAPINGSIVINSHTITPNPTGAPTHHITLTYTEPHDPAEGADPLGQSGMDYYRIIREKGTGFKGSCSFSTITASVTIAEHTSGTTPVPPLTLDDTSVLTSGCYRYVLKAADKVSNETTWTSSTVEVDLDPPTISNVTLTQTSPAPSATTTKVIQTNNPAAGGPLQVCHTSNGSNGVQFIVDGTVIENAGGVVSTVRYNGITNFGGGTGMTNTRPGTLISGGTTNGVWRTQSPYVIGSGAHANGSDTQFIKATDDSQNDGYFPIVHTVDDSGPSFTSVSAVKTGTGTNANGVWVNTAVTVSFAATDNGCAGIDHYVVSDPLVGTSTYAPGQTYTTVVNGNRTVTITAWDKLGNTTQTSVQLMIDTVAPPAATGVTLATDGSTGSQGDAGTGAIANGPVGRTPNQLNWTWTANDNAGGSGIDQPATQVLACRIGTRDFDKVDQTWDPAYDCGLTSLGVANNPFANRHLQTLGATDCDQTAASGRAGCALVGEKFAVRVQDLAGNVSPLSNTTYGANNGFAMTGVYTTGQTVAYCAFEGTFCRSWSGNKPPLFDDITGGDFPVTWVAGGNVTASGAGMHGANGMNVNHPARHTGVYFAFTRGTAFQNRCVVEMWTHHSSGFQPAIALGLAVATGADTQNLTPPLNVAAAWEKRRVQWSQVPNGSTSMNFFTYLEGNDPGYSWRMDDMAGWCVVA